MSRRRNARLKKKIITAVKWLSAILPVVTFVYILYYYHQFDFLFKQDGKVVKTVVLNEAGSGGPSQNVATEVVKQVKVASNEWHSVGGIAVHDVTIENNSDQALTGVEIEFKYLSETQSVLTTKVITIKSALPAKKVTKVPEVSVGYVNRSVTGCDTRIIRAFY